MKLIKYHRYFFVVLFCMYSLISTANHTTVADTPKIQMALLLDISGSMNGLINQTQGQLWNLVNEMSTYKKKEITPQIELAVIAYGNGTIENRYTEVLSEFTSEIDVISEKLFNIKTYGGNEWCADAIQIALDTLNWSSDTNDLKVMIIAGNERFDQSAMSYDSICKIVGERDILLNTVFCGEREIGIEMLWESAAIIGNGRYANINQDLELKREETPFDDKVAQFYEQYKTMYVFFGDSAAVHFQRIQNQDYKVKRMGKAFFRERIIYKLSHEPLKSYDLIDVFQKGRELLHAIPKEKLPDALQELSKKDLEKFVIQYQMKRDFLKSAIEVYAEQVSNYYNTIYKNEEEKTFEMAIQAIIQEQLSEKGFGK